MATNWLIQLLAPEALAALYRYAVLKELKLGEVLAESGDDISKIYFPHSGIISAMVDLDDGSSIQTFMVGRDGAIGAAQAFDSKKSINKVVVQIGGQASVVPRDHVRQLAEDHPSIKAILSTHEQFIIADIQQTAACNARHSVEERMARWVLRMRDLVGDDFPLTQDHLAAMIGTRRTSVGAVAQKMQRGGAVSYHRGKMHVAKADALERQTCECYRSVQRNYLSLFGTSWPQPDELAISSSKATHRADRSNDA